jgi:hypothetical protein
MRERRRLGSKRRWGYAVWVVAALVVAVPEITAAFSHGALGFITISETIGHLERYHSWVELGVVAAIVLVVFSLARVSVSRAGMPAEEGGPARTTGGRLTFRPTEAGMRSPRQFDDERAPVVFAVVAAAALAAVAAGGWAASRWWDDPRRFHVSFVVYLPLALLWLVIPNLVAAVAGADVPFPTMFRTIQNLEGWLRLPERPWSEETGARLAWLVAYVIFAGLAILLIHLTLYPFPDVTHVLNPAG